MRLLGVKPSMIVCSLKMIFIINTLCLINTENHISILGAFMMGVGYWLTEKLEYDQQTGALITNRTWTYKIPGAKDIPIDFRIKFLQNVSNEGIFGSKATGEPALTLSIVTIFALRHAIDSIREDNGKAKNWYRLGMFSGIKMFPISIGLFNNFFRVKFINFQVQQIHLT